MREARPRTDGTVHAAERWPSPLTAVSQEHDKVFRFIKRKSDLKENWLHEF